MSLAHASQRTVFSIDYHDETGTLAACGNFGEMKLFGLNELSTQEKQYSQGLQGLVEKSLDLYQDDQLSK